MIYAIVLVENERYNVEDSHKIEEKFNSTA